MSYRERECYPLPLFGLVRKGPAPELPDGYRVDSILGDLTLSHWEGRMVACLHRTGELGIPARVASAKDTEAIIAFLQGAGWLN